MGDYDRRVQKLEAACTDPTQHNFCLVIPEKGETTEAAKLRIGIGPDARCLAIKFVAAKDGRRYEPD